MYGHLHYAKTGGSTINGMLAAKYERVCGHKGYSYDAYQFNKGVEQQMQQQNVSAIDSSSAGGNDVIRKSYRKNWNRGRVPPRVMDEIGYENCDYISLEDSWSAWNRMDDIWNFELHVPCRDPIDHLLSQCNHQRKTFDCQANDVAKEVQSCFVEPNRFGPKLVQKHQPHFKNHSVKCFNPIPVQPYLAYMDQRLQHKRMPAVYMSRSTNQKRHQARECLYHENNTEIANKVRQYLVQKVPYYRWCHQCLMDPDKNLLFHVNTKG